MNHTAAIHAIKAKLKLSEEDYRALLVNLTGKDSCKSLGPVQLAKVRQHMDNLAVRMGVAKPHANASGTIKKRMKPTTGLIYSLWQQCADKGAINDRSFAAMNTFVKHQTGVDHADFLAQAQVSTIKKALETMRDRGPAK
jgi:phage gp16-like protein